MLACISCAKQVEEGDEEEGGGGSASKEGVKSLTSQVRPFPWYSGNKEPLRPN